MRHLFVIAGLIMLASCATEPGPAADVNADGLAQWLTGVPSQGPSFGIATIQQAPTQAGHAELNKAGPLLAAAHAEQICTLGYQRTADETAPGEDVPFTVTTIRCTAYRPSF